MSIVESTDKNFAYLELANQFINPALPTPLPIVAERAVGSHLFDMNGNDYLDFASGIATTNIGHCHPKVVAAIQKQASELMHTSVVIYHKRYIELAKKLAEISPGKLDSVFLANSGAEAIEGAVKLVRYVTGRPAFINFRGSFHGRTMMTTALTTSKLYYREKYEPLPGPIFTSKYPYVYRSEFRNNPEACMQDSLNYLEMLLHQFVDPRQVAGFLIEPILGEGGFVIPPSGFLKKLQAIARKHNILLMIDEVQTGFGRTGKLFACEHENIVPDVMIMAKGIANGMPLSAFVASRELTKEWPSGRHGSTFGGNPVCCAAALATIGVLEEEKLTARAASLGQEMLSTLKDFAKNKAHIGEVRGKGLMIGIEFNDKKGEPGTDVVKHVVQECFNNKLLVLSCGSNSQVIRLIPPLNISDADAQKGIEILCKSMTI